MTYDPFRSDQPPAPPTSLDFVESDAEEATASSESREPLRAEPPRVSRAEDVIVVRARPARWVWMLPLWLVAGTLLGALVEHHTGLLNEALPHVIPELGNGTEVASEEQGGVPVPQVTSPRPDPIDLGLTDTSEALTTAIEFASQSTVLISAHNDPLGRFRPSLRPQGPPSHSAGTASDAEEPLVAESLGAGVVYRVTDESVYVLTNQHVIEGSNTVHVTLHGGFVTEAFFAAADPRVDLALLEIPRRDIPFRPARAVLADSDELRPGHFVLALGQPAGYQHTATLGIVSAVGRPSLPSGESPFVHYLQSSAPINRGNSGGPLVDLRGRVVGLNTWKVREAEGLGFALPANFVRRVADDLIEHRRLRWPYLGVRLREFDAAARAQFGDGVWIEAVQPSAPAAEAELRPNDILRQIGRERVRSITDVYRALSPRRPGESVVLVIERSRRERTRTVTLAEDPRGPYRASEPEAETE